MAADCKHTARASAPGCGGSSRVAQPWPAMYVGEASPARVLLAEVSGVGGGDASGMPAHRAPRGP